REPVIEFILRGFPGINFEPLDFAFAAISLLNRAIEHALAGCPNVGPGAIAADERQDRVIRHLQLSILDRDFSASRWGNVFVRRHGQYFNRFKTRFQKTVERGQKQEDKGRGNGRFKKAGEGPRTPPSASFFELTPDTRTEA